MEVTINKNYIQGHIDTVILRVLKDNDCYGLEFIKAVSTLSGGQYFMKEQSLYTALKRLEAKNWVKSYWGDESRAGRRRYYTITKKGKEAHTKFVNEWRLARNVINFLVDDWTVD